MEKKNNFLSKQVTNLIQKLIRRKRGHSLSYHIILNVVKFTGDSYLKYCPMLNSGISKLTIHIVQIWIGKRIFSWGWISEFGNQIVTSLWNVKLNANELMNSKDMLMKSWIFKSPLRNLHHLICRFEFFLSHFYILSSSTRITITNDETLSWKNIVIRYTLI